MQRVSPTEKRGRVHTSTVTVSVIDPDSIEGVDNLDKIDDNNFRIEWFSGTGCGGQHRNKKQNSCRVIHIPTGFSETRQGRKREANLRDAKDALIQKLAEMQTSHKASTFSEIKKKQMGSGMRGDKIRTYRFQDDRVIDHQTGKSAKATKVMKGRFDLLWV